MRWLQAALTLAIIWVATAQAVTCPRTCECLVEKIECFYTRVPEDHLTQVILKETAKINTTILREIKWVNSYIKVLAHNTFENSYNLEDIDLSGNELKRTEHGIFGRLTQLKQLNISRNKLEDIPRFTFADLESLKVLDISHNQLSSIPFQVFASMTELLYLDISHNKIASFLDYYFKPNRHLQTLFLNHNNLVKITSNALVDLRELEVLDLSSNQLDYLPKLMFDTFEQLRKLNLNYNPIQNISHDTFKKLFNLTELRLGGNRIKALPTGLFLYNENLLELYLEFTDLSVIQNTNFKGLNKLTKLFLRNNTHLREIEAFVFQDTPSITHLDISANSLTFLPLSLNSLNTLEELKMNKNPWACDCRMAWFVDWVEARKTIIKSDLSCSHAYPDDMLRILNHTNCKPPTLISSSPLTLYRLRSNALLECKYQGNPAPSITWITPTRAVYHWNPDILIPDIFSKHGAAHDQYYRPIDSRRIRVLENGSLLITDIHREDTGTYLCFATNPKANVSAEVILNIDPMTMYEIKMYSLLFGGVCAAAFLGLTLLVQCLCYIFHRFV